jgi:predicted YcjX-like family ATPase
VGKIRLTAKLFGRNLADSSHFLPFLDRKNILVECLQTENQNNDAIKLFKQSFPNRIEVVRGGSVAVEAISMSER